MKLRTLACVALTALVVAASPALANGPNWPDGAHGGGGWHGGGWAGHPLGGRFYRGYGGPIIGFGYPYAVYPYAYLAPSVVGSAVFYFCPPLNAYYPQVASCPVPWVTVVAPPAP